MLTHRFGIGLLDERRHVDASVAKCQLRKILKCTSLYRREYIPRDLPRDIPRDPPRDLPRDQSRDESRDITHFLMRNHVIDHVIDHVIVLN